MEETGNILIIFGICEYIRGYKIKVRGVEVNVFVKLCGDISEMPQFMNQCWTMEEALEFP